MSFKDTYMKEIAPKLKEELEIKNDMATPIIDRVVVNAGIGTWRAKNKDHAFVVDQMAALTGQKPVVTMAKKSVSNFNKLREGTPNGVKVTLRGERAYDFIEKLIKIVYPRVHDFRGVSTKSFDGQGNISFGFKDCSVFTEVDSEDLGKLFGLEVTVVTTAKDDEGARKMFDLMKFPFKK